MGRDVSISSRCLTGRDDRRLTQAASALVDAAAALRAHIGMICQVYSEQMMVARANRHVGDAVRRQLVDRDSIPGPPLKISPRGPGAQIVASVFNRRQAGSRMWGHKPGLPNTTRPFDPCIVTGVYMQNKSGRQMNKRPLAASSYIGLDVRFCEGYRMPAGVRYPPKREAAGSTRCLWVFRFSLCRAGVASACGKRMGCSERGAQGRRGA